MTQESPQNLHEGFVALCTEVVKNYCVIGETTISVATTYPAFHLRVEDGRTSGGRRPSQPCFMNNTEFAHVHAKFMETEDSEGHVDPSGHGRFFASYP
ncbi:unnamed protein product [Amoebophrya sp. A25]|nr:unnamed protein product [Amoebophrya sp. A25]|eukprot:GSA25T00007724001.1